MAMSSHIAVKVQNYAVARCTTMTEMDTGCKKYYRLLNYIEMLTAD